jgi:hypothetical protein
MDTRLTAPRKEKALETTVRKEIEALRHMTLTPLKKKYVEVFGEENRSHHKHFLFRRIAWRIQALAEGGLSERARRRAMEIANDADLRVRAPKTTFQQDFSGDRSAGRERPQRQKPFAVDTFGRMEIARQAKADDRLELYTRTSAWLRFSSDPLH